MCDASDQPATGRFEGGEHRFPVRVYYEDTDLSGIVYHASHLRFMERARSEMLHQARIDQRATHEAGDGSYAIAELAIRYRAPARLYDALVVASRVARVAGASCRIAQRIARADVTISEADVVAVFVGMDGRPRRQPAPWIETFRRLAKDATNP